jgi:uncharacterized protein (DUF2147 family)
MRKGARLLGLTIVSGMKRDNSGYSGGNIIDPTSGRSFPATLSFLRNDEELAVLGRFGGFCCSKGQVWRRLPDGAISSVDIPKEVLSGASE